MISLVAASLLLYGSKVQVLNTSGKAQLIVDGKPYVVKGAGGNQYLPLLAASGGNSIRTWGADNLEPLLDEAQKLGIKVTVGIWLGHKEHGFKWDDPAQVQAQFNKTKEFVERYKNHPAVLMWGLGNEMEGFDQGDDPNVWNAIEDLAHMVKKTDPNHPTMTVIAEIGGKKVPSVMQMCPSIDILGINSYGGVQSIYDRYTKQGGTKPYIITEYGPAGTWETAKTPWGRPIEPTSTEKEKSYFEAYQANVTKHPDLCLGAYAFVWGNKQEATATWYGMFLPDGTKTAAVDAMEKAWTGKDTKYPCPKITKLTVEGDAAVDPEDVVNASLVTSDPNGDPIKVRWSLTEDGGTIGLNGDKEDVPDVIEGSVTSSSSTGATIKMPKKPGMYRLFVVVRNAHSGAAVANVPLRVRGATPISLGGKAKLPLSIYTDAGAQLPFSPSGWMGNVGSMKLGFDSTVRPHSGKTCIKWDLSATNSWGAIAWQNPEGDWGDKPGGYDLTGAKKLVVWARGENGGEELSLALGIIKSDKKYFDTAIVDGGKRKLTTLWQKFEIPLTGKDLTRVKTGLVMTLNSGEKPATVYIDDISIEP